MLFLLSVLVLFVLLYFAVKSDLTDSGYSGYGLPSEDYYHRYYYKYYHGGDERNR